MLRVFCATWQPKENENEGGRIKPISTVITCRLRNSSVSGRSQTRGSACLISWAWGRGTRRTESHMFARLPECFLTLALIYLTRMVSFVCKCGRCTSLPRPVSGACKLINHQVWLRRITLCTLVRICSFELVLALLRAWNIQEVVLNWEHYRSKPSLRECFQRFPLCHQSQQFSSFWENSFNTAPFKSFLRIIKYPNGLALISCSLFFGNGEGDAAVYHNHYIEEMINERFTLLLWGLFFGWRGCSSS